MTDTETTGRKWWLNGLSDRQVKEDNKEAQLQTARAAVGRCRTPGLAPESHSETDMDRAPSGPVVPDHSPDRDIRDAAWRAVTAASSHWQQSTNALRHILRTALTHGLTVEDIAEASGLTDARVIDLLRAGA